MYRKLIIILVAFIAIGLSGCSDGEGIDMNDGGELPFGNLSAFSIDRIEPTVASPGDEVTIYGPGLNSETDKVIAGNTELTVNSSINIALSAITGEEESDAVDGQLRFTITDDLELGTLPVKVVRGEMESNIVDVEIVPVDDGVDGNADDDDEDDTTESNFTGCGGLCKLSKVIVKYAIRLGNMPANYREAMRKVAKLSWAFDYEKVASAKIYVPALPQKWFDNDVTALVNGDNLFCADDAGEATDGTVRSAGEAAKMCNSYANDTDMSTQFLFEDGKTVMVGGNEQHKKYCNTVIAWFIPTCLVMDASQRTEGYATFTALSNRLGPSKATLEIVTTDGETVLEELPL